MADGVVNVQVNAIGNFGNVIGEVGKLRTQLQSLKLPKNITDNLNKGLENVETKFSHFQSLLSKGINTKGDFSKLLSSAKEVDQVINKLQKDVKAVGNKDLEIAVLNSAEIKQAQQSLEKVLNIEKQLKSFGSTKSTGALGADRVAEITKLANTSKGLKGRFDNLTSAFKTGNIDQVNGALERLVAHVQRYQQAMNNSKATPNKGDQMLQWANEVKQALTQATQEAERAKMSFDKLKSTRTSQMKSDYDAIAGSINRATNEVRNFTNQQTSAANKTVQLNDQIGVLRNQANYFFGLQNIGRLISRGIREAAESVRDLDKAMTETAVVTDFSVSDMWGMLPEYTKLANKLGATTQGAYETMTLYFQQGLDKKATFEIGEETMKMARIAGLDYVQTTNMMTAALRGFNMELNQTSAQRVNDVYSKLAAITASDTRELGLAMERTASIAHSAGMDFGNTTAFLAQMIETTREAPENLGTAMKTIVARFQELKENPYQISEVEGEEVDFNRVDKALKSIGVELMDNRDKFRDLDDVFMDISERWDGLSQTQQRYVATIAAGARQQSRFLAMVQNYDRLKELTEAAANSEGASNVQFNKTLESYEAKVNQLSNAWQAFTMSLANNRAVKFAVDFLQKVVSFGNTIIKTFGKVGSVFGETGKGIGEMVAAFGLAALGFKGLKFGAERGLGALAKMTHPSMGGTKSGGYFTGGIDKNVNAEKALAGQISNPIVRAIDRVASLLNGNKNINPASTSIKERSEAIRQRRNNLYGMMTEEHLGDKKLTPSLFSAKDVSKQLQGLTKEEQLAIKRSMPLLSNALQKGHTKAFEKMDLSSSAKKQIAQYSQTLDREVANGKLSWNESLSKKFDPYTVGKEIGGNTGKEIFAALDKEIANSKYSSKKYQKKFTREALASGITDRQQIKDYVKNRQRQTIANDPNKQAGMFAASTSGISKGSVALAQFTSAANSAGQAVMGIGMAISAAGFPAFGMILTTIGSGLMGVGMAAESASSAISKLATTFGIGFGPMAAILAAATAVAIGIGVAVHKHKKAVAELQKDAKKIEKTYNDTINKTTKNINKFTDELSTFSTLTMGVDANGNNVNLGTEEYADYLKIVNDIAKAHPELVKGYNAHGQAIIDNNTALKEAIELEKKEQKEAEKEYTKAQSLQTMIEARQTTKRWAVGKHAEAGTRAIGKTAVKTDVGKSQLESDAQAVIDNIKKLKNGDELLRAFEEQFGLENKAFEKLDEKGIKVISEHGQEMLNQVETNFTDAGEETQKQIGKVQDSIAQVGKDTTGLEEVTEPIYKSLSTYASRKGLFDHIPEELRFAAEAGLKEIAKMDVDPATGKQITGAAMQGYAENMAKKMENLNGHSEEYKDLLKDVEKAQSDFAKDTDKQDYTDATDKSITKLAFWAEQARDLYEEYGDASQLALAEAFDNQIAQIQNFVSDGAAILSEGFNSMADKIEVANNAYESFQKQTEGGDYYTGAENMKQIFDDIKDGVDDAGRGSQTFWKGAKELLGENFVNENSFSKVNKQLEQFKNLFYDANGEVLEGGAAVENFFDYLQSKQGTKLSTDLFPKGKDGKPQTIADFFKVTDEDLDFNLNDMTDEQFTALADSLGMSDQLLASMLNKAKQFYDIDFSNVEVLRKAIGAEGMPSIRGEGKTGDNQDLYVRESTFDAEAGNQGYSPDEIKKFHDTVSKEGIKLIPDANTLTGLKKGDFVKEMSGYISGMGIETTQGFVDTFSQLGFSKDELKTLYDRGVETGLLEENKYDNFDDYYNDTLKKQEESAANAAEEQIVDNTGKIASTAEGILSALGVNQGYGEDALEWVFKGKGEDSVAQHFASGKDEYGNFFKTDEDFKAADQSLTDKIEEWKVQRAGMKAGLSELHGKERAELQDEIDGLDLAIQKTEEYQEAGRQAYEEKKQQDQPSTTDTSTGASNTTDNSQEQEQVNQLNESYKNLGLTKEQIKENGFNDFTPNEEQLANLDSMGNKIQVLKDESILSKENVQQLGSVFSELGPEKLANLDQTGFSEIIRNLDLTKEKTQALNEIAPKIGIDIDTNETETVVDKAKSWINKAFSNFQPQPAKVSNVLDMSEAIEKAKTKIKEIFNIDGKSLELPAPKIGAAFTGAIEKAKGFIKKVFSGGDEQPQQPAEPKKGGKSQQSTVTNNITLSSNVTNPQEPKQKINDIMPKNYKKTVSATITLNPTVKSGGLKGAIQEKVTNAASGLKAKTTATVKAKSEGQAGVAALKASINDIKGKNVKVKADVSGTSNVNSLVDAISDLHDKTVTVTYKQKGKPGHHTGGMVTGGDPIYRARGGLASDPRFKREGTDTVPAMLTPGEYVHNRDAVQYFGVDFMRRINHKDLQGALQSFGSAAKGYRHGTVGPNNKGGLTLTGENGFEIAWIPSENRSMILGANGPQMVDLPSDAVVWTNEQSKKILKQEAIPAGSHNGKSINYKGKRRKRDNNNNNSNNGNRGSGNNGSGNNGGGNHGGGNHGGGNSRGSGKWKWVKADGKVNTKIYNIEKKIEQVKIKQAEAQKKLNKLLENAAATLKSVSGEGNKNYKWLKKTISLNEQLRKIYDDRLKKLDKSQKVTIKYQQKQKKGKKTRNKTRKSKVNLGAYIYQDPETGAYQIDYQKINKKFKNKKQKQAIVDAAKKRIDENTSKRDSAQQAIDDAQDKLDEMGQKLYETFFGWKNELTEIYGLTKQIEDSEKRISLLKDSQSLRDAMIASGLSKQLSDTTKAFIDNGMQMFRQQMSVTLQEIRQKAQAIKLQKQNINSLASGEETTETLKVTNNTITAAKASIAYQDASEKASAAQEKVDKDNKAIDARNNLLKTTSTKQEKKKKAKASKKIKKDNKKISNIKKKAKKKNRKLTKSEKNRIANIKQDRSEQKKKQTKAQQNINTINKGAKAKKDIVQDQKNLNELNEKLEQARLTAQSLGVDASTYTNTELLALEARQEALQEQQAIENKAKQFIKTTTNADGSISVSLDAESLEKARNDATTGMTEEMYNGIKEYYDGLIESNQELLDLMSDEIQLLTDLYEQLTDLQEQYADYSEELLNAAEEAQEKEVDRLEKLNKSLSDALKNLLDEVKNRLEERRQQEDNAKKEQDISQKQNRLAALRADSSGANAKEIKQLEKEIAEAQQSYGRELEDQQLQKLQDQADKASEQRERQIELLSSQLEYAKATGSNLAEVNKLLAEIRSEDESTRTAAIARAESLLMENEDYENSTDARRVTILSKIQTVIDGLQLLPQKIDETKSTIAETENDSDILETLNKWSNETLTLKGEEFVNGILGGQSWNAAQAKAVGVSLGTIIKTLQANNLSDAAIAEILKNANINYEEAKSFALDDKDIVKYGIADYGRLKEEYDKVNSNTTNEKLKAAGAKPEDLLGLDIAREEILKLGYEVKDLKDAGFSFEEMFEADYKTPELKSGGFTATDFKNNNISDDTIFDNFSVEELKDSGLYTLQQLRQRFSDSQLKSGGYTATDFKNNEVGYEEASKTFDFNELLGANYTEAVKKDSYNKKITAAQSNKKIGKDEFKKVAEMAAAAGIGPRTFMPDLAETKGLTWKQVFTAASQAGYSKERMALTFTSKAAKKGFNAAFGDGAWKKYYNKAVKNKKTAYAYKSGGLASYTGPAWLDGTPSKPELVLNAQDTKNFMALRDVLDKAVGSTSSVTNTNETAMYEININVDHINSDYDVDKIAARIKKDIIKDAGYRNVTQVRNFR